MYKIGFIIEQALGHVTHGQNLQSNVVLDPSIEAHWGLPSWEAAGLAMLIPNWTVKAGLQALQAVANMQRQTQLDALFFHTQVTAVLSQKWLKRIPSVVSLDATPQQYDQLGQYYVHATGPDWLERWKWKLNRNVLHTARHLVSWSHWAKAGLSVYDIPAAKVTVIPPGVNVSAWTLPQPRRLQTTAVKLLFVGGDLERKGGRVLLTAFRRLRERLLIATNPCEIQPKIELHLVTKTAVAPEPGLFVYNDMQPNSSRLKQLYFDSDIFCLPTHGDCLPLALAEAGAAGLPLVSSNVAAIPEIVQDGKTGFLVPPGDVDGLTNSLKRLVDHPNLRLRLGEQAYQLVQNEHDSKKNAQKLINLLKSVATNVNTNVTTNVNTNVNTSVD